LSLSLNVPPWEELHELSREELRLTNLVTTDMIAEVLPPTGGSMLPTVALTAKPTKDRFVSSTVDAEENRPSTKSHQDGRGGRSDRAAPRPRPRSSRKFRHGCHSGMRLLAQARNPYSRC